MTDAARHITIDKDSDLGRQLAEAKASGASVVIEVGGDAYRLTPEDPWQNYDPEKAREALRRSAGALKGIDRAALLRDLRAARGHDDCGREP